MPQLVWLKGCFLFCCTSHVPVPVYTLVCLWLCLVDLLSPASLRLWHEQLPSGMAVPTRGSSCLVATKHTRLKCHGSLEGCELHTAELRSHGWCHHGKFVGPFWLFMLHVCLKGHPMCVQQQCSTTSVCKFCFAESACSTVAGSFELHPAYGAGLWATMPNCLNSKGEAFSICSSSASSQHLCQRCLADQLMQQLFVSLTCVAAVSFDAGQTCWQPSSCKGDVPIRFHRFAAHILSELTV